MKEMFVSFFDNVFSDTWKNGIIHVYSFLTEEELD